MKTIIKLDTVRASGNRESWFKTITGIIEGATGAKGFSGDYLKAGENRLEVGTILLHVWPSGSVKHGIHKADLLRVNPDGTTAEIVAGLDWRQEYPSIQDHLRVKLGIDFGQTTADGRFTLLPTCCIGYCDRAPAMMINRRVYGQLTPERIDEILEGLE